MNFSEIADKVKSISFVTVDDVQVFVDLVVEKAADNAKTCAKLLVEIQNITSNSSELTINELLIKKCHDFVGYNQIYLQTISENSSFVQFIGELYQVGIIEFDFVLLCLRLLTVESGETAVSCLETLLMIVGDKADKEDKKDFDEYFKQFIEFAEPKDSNRSTIFKALTELRKNKWKQNDEPAIKKILNAVTENGVQSTVTRLNKILGLSDSNINVFISVLWKCILTNPTLIQSYVTICKEFSTNQTFCSALNQFLMIRSIEFTDFQHSNILQTRLSNSAIFVAKCFVENVVVEKTLESWIKPEVVKLISLDSSSEILSIIELKAKESNSDSFKDSIVNLEEIYHEKSLRAMKELKTDIEEITEMFQKVNKQNL